MRSECGGGLLLLRHVTPLTRRDVVYFYSGAHTSSIAGSPSFVPGILMKRFGLAAFVWSAFAAARVPVVLYASRGETSSETQPSMPFVRSWMGRKRSAAWLKSSIANSKKSASPDLPSVSF